MPWIHREGQALYHQRHGQGPALVLLHGAGSNGATWWQQLGPFSTDHTCLVPDLRCFGRSAAPLEGFRLEVFVADLIAMLDAEGVAQATLLGQSLGGMVALRAALDHPDRVRALVLCDSSLAIDHPQQLQVLRDRLSSVGGLSIEQRSLGAWFLEHRPALAALYAQIQRFNPSHLQHPPAQWQAALARLNESRELTPMARLRELRCPTLLLVGREDPIVPLAVMQQVQSLVPGSELCVVEQAAHSAYFEQPEVFNARVLEFLVRLG